MEMELPLILFGGWVGQAIAGAATLGVAAWNAIEAKKNRDFQERMSSTAHTREVRDLKAAGLNPMLSANRGSSSPGGDRAEIPIGTAMQIARYKSETALIDAQTQREVATAQNLTDQTGERFAGREFRLNQLSSEAQVAALSVQERRALLPFVQKQAEAEIKQMSSSAAQSRANARLAQLDQVRAMNEAEFEAALGAASPALRSLLLIVRSLR